MELSTIDGYMEGCAAILKHSELSSTTCLELAEVCREAGLPPGALDILTRLGLEAGAHLAPHPNFDKVQLSSFHRSFSLCHRALMQNLAVPRGGLTLLFFILLQSIFIQLDRCGKRLFVD